jgi:hypothetical protein
MSNHTPGPWIVNGPHDASWVSTADHRTILPETMANARLIAAAPQMLDALHEVLALLNNPDADGTDANRVEREILAVIAKATGEQP